MSDANSNPRTKQNLDEQLAVAAEELVTGDSDDPPLSEDAVAEMLEPTLNARRPDHSKDV
jgi:hypothetical protein